MQNKNIGVTHNNNVIRATWKITKEKQMEIKIWIINPLEILIRLNAKIRY